MQASTSRGRAARRPLDQNDHKLAELGLARILQDTGGKANLVHIWVPGYAPMDKRMEAYTQFLAKHPGLHEIARFGKVTNNTSLQTEVANAERIREHITIEKDFADVPALHVERHKVVQILVNLISNALQAIDRSGREQGTLTLRIRGEGAGTVVIEVRDNGVGIPPEHMGRLFQYGFTTRESGHGFGLHSCAITALELGGELKVASEGTGKGACFTLKLPLGGG